MTVRSRMIPFLSAAILLFSAAGCNGSYGAKAESDVLLEWAGIPADTAMLTVDGAEIPADLYYYWLGCSLDFLDFSRYNGEGLLWSDEIDGMSVSEYAKRDALETVRLYAAAQRKAEELVCGFDEDTQTKLNGARSDFVASVGGEEAFALYLRGIGLREESFLHLISVFLLCDQLKSHLYGENGPRSPTQETIDAYCAQEGLLRVKYIRIPFADETGAPFAERERSAREKLSFDLARRLRESEAPEDLFQELMGLYSEDPGAIAHPDGYVFSRGRMLEYDEDSGQYLFQDGGMAEELYSAAAALEPGKTGGPVSCGGSWYILLRLPVFLEQVREAYCQADFSRQLTLWKEESSVSFSEAYEAADPQAYYNRLLQAQLPSPEPAG
jgi:hypothetical protein